VLSLLLLLLLLLLLVLAPPGPSLAFPAAASGWCRW
jgi:hypothetical protein